MPNPNYRVTAMSLALKVSRLENQQIDPTCKSVDNSPKFIRAV
jgi:hypothetical protein